MIATYSVHFVNNTLGNLLKKLRENDFYRLNQEFFIYMNVSPHTYNIKMTVNRHYQFSISGRKIKVIRKASIR